MLEVSLKQLLHDISLLELYIKNNQESGFYDMTRILESLTISIFNEAFGYNLINKNQLQPNFPAIDLADDIQGVAIQVTTNANAQKVRHTIEKFQKNNFHKKYNSLIIYGFLKNSRLTTLPKYCKLIKTGEIISAITDKNDVNIVENIRESLIQHIDYSKIHPYADTQCLEIILNCIDRNAIKHKMHIEGSYIDMVTGLNEITEIISKGTIRRKDKTKSVDQFYDSKIKNFLTTTRNDIGKIVGVVNKCRMNDGDFVCLDYPDVNKIDELKKTIIINANQIAHSYNLDFEINTIE